MFQALTQTRNQLMFSTAFDYFCKELGLTKEERELISVREVNRLDVGTSGTCGGIYDKSGNIMRVEIKLLSYASVAGMIDVLAHELVHARQHVRGEFTFETIKVPVFFGLLNVNALAKFHGGQRLDITPYYDRLCEREAHNLAYVLIAGFFSLLAQSLKEETESKEIADGNTNTIEGTETREVEEGPVLAS